MADGGSKSVGVGVGFGERALKDALRQAEALITDFAMRGDVTNTMTLIYGASADFGSLPATWAAGMVAFPQVEVVGRGDLPGSDGAYLTDRGKILVSEALFDADGVAVSAGRLVDVLLEEFGHHVDALVNDTDVPGDEGAKFAVAVRGEPATVLSGELSPETGKLLYDGEVAAAEFATSVSDSGGYEGSSQTLKLENTGGGRLKYFYEHYTIPDRFIIRYEGATLLDTGFTGGSRSGEIAIPDGQSDQLEIRIVTDDEGTAWNYSVEAETCPSPSPLVVEANGGTFTHNPDTGKCETTSEVTVGREDGIRVLARFIPGKGVSYDRGSIALEEGRFFAVIGGVSDLLFQGSVTLATGTQKGAITETGNGTFKLAGLEVDFKEVTVLRDALAFDVLFRLPDQASGIVVDTVKIFEDALIIDQNGPHFVLGGKLSFPDPKKFSLLNIVDVEAKNITVEYRPQEDALRLQAKLTIDKFAKTVGGISSVEADLSGSNYIQVRGDNDVDLVGKIKVGRTLQTPQGWGLSAVELAVDTNTKEVGGSATVRTPFGVKFGDGATIKPSLEFRTGPLQLDSVGLEVDNLNIPIPGYPAFLFQRVAGKVDNFAPDNTKDVEFSGGVSATLGPQIAGNRLARLDLDGKITSKQIEGSSTLDILTADFNTFGQDNKFTLIKSIGTATLDWNKGYLQQTGSFNLLDGFVTTNTTLKFDKSFNFSAGGGATVGLPGFVPVFGGTSLANSSYAIQFVNDSDYSNDFIAGWGQITIRKLGFEADITSGLRVNFDGTMERIGSHNIPPIGSWAIVPDQDYVLFSARWENATPDAEMVVILPDRTRLTEAEFAAHGIAVVEEFSSATERTVIAFNPVAGVWDIEMADPAGLGTIRTEALGATEAPTFSFATAPLDVSGTRVSINYEAFDSDSDAKVTFYYDDDATGANGILIGSAKEADGAGSFVWNASAVVPGEYFIYALVDDGENVPLIAYTDRTVSVGSEADLAAGIAASAEEVVSGAAITYTIDVQNLSAADAQGVHAMVSLPAGAILRSSSIAPVAVKGSELTFDLGALAGNGAAVIELAVTAPNVTDTTALSADVVVFADSYDPEPANDSAFVDVLAKVPDAARVDLTVAASNPPTGLKVGDRFSYTVTVTNVGPDTATGVVLDEFLDNASGISISSGSTLDATSLRANIGSLTAGESRAITVSGTALAAGQLTSSSRVSAGGTGIELAPLNNEEVRSFAVASTVPSPADLSGSLSAGTPDANDRVTLRVTVLNSGPGVASNIETKIDLPAGVVVQGVSSVQGSFNPATGVWTLGNLRDGIDRDLLLTLDGKNASGTGMAVAEIVRVDESDPDSTPGNGVPGEDDYATVQIISVNHPPTLAEPVLSYTVAEGETLQKLYAQILANARDQDPSDADKLTIDVLDLSSTNGFVSFDPTSQRLTYTADGFDATKSTDSFTYTVSDGRGGAVTGTVALTVTGDSLSTWVGTADADVYRSNGSGRRLIGGDGDDLLRTNGADQRVFGGRGDDNIAVNGDRSVVYGGPGADTIRLNGARQSVILQQGGVDDIYGFRLGNGSTIDLRQVLAEAEIDLGKDLGKLDGYVQVSTSRNDATLSFNPNGLVSGPGNTLAVLHGVGANTTLSTLIDSGVLKID